MQVCALTELQAKQFEHTGIVPDCRHLNSARKRAGLEPSEREGSHLHIPYHQAEHLVGEDRGDGMARWVGGRFMIAMNTKRGWNSVQSQRVRVMQMTRETSAFRHANDSSGNRGVPAVGARERRTTVRQTNQPQQELTNVSMAEQHC